MNLQDRSIRLLLAVIAVLLGANLLVQSGVGPRRVQAAGIPDTGAQFQSMVDNLTELNKKVDKLDTFIESGALVVNVKAKEEKEK
jgi:hypothetical protein